MKAHQKKNERLSSRKSKKKFILFFSTIFILYFISSSLFEGTKTAYFRLHVAVAQNRRKKRRKLQF